MESGFDKSAKETKKLINKICSPKKIFRSPKRLDSGSKLKICSFVKKPESYKKFKQELLQSEFVLDVYKVYSNIIIVLSETK